MNKLDGSGIILTGNVGYGGTLDSARSFDNGSSSFDCIVRVLYASEGMRVSGGKC